MARLGALLQARPWLVFLPVVAVVFVGISDPAPAAVDDLLRHIASGFYPVNVLNAVKAVPEVCRIFCATANSVEVVLAQTEQGRAVLGVVDGMSPKGIESEEDVAHRKSFLRAIGYKL